MTQPDPRPAPPRPTHAGPRPDAVWTRFGDTCPEVGARVYVRRDADFDPAVPYAFMEGDDGGWCPHLGVVRHPDGRLVRDGGGRVAPGYSPFSVLHNAEWTYADPSEAPAGDLARLVDDFLARPDVTSRSLDDEADRAFVRDALLGLLRGAL